MVCYQRHNLMKGLSMDGYHGTEKLILWLFVFTFCLYVQVWAASGEQRDCSGDFQGSSPHKWATLVALPRTPHITRSAQVLCFAHFCIFAPATHGIMLHNHAAFIWGGELSWQDISLWNESRFKREKKAKHSQKGCFKYSTLIFLPPSLHLQSSTQNALLQMGCTSPIPTLPWPTCKDWALYCAVLQRFCQQRLLCMKLHKWASFLETRFWQTWCWRYKLKFCVFAIKGILKCLANCLCLSSSFILFSSSWDSNRSCRLLIYNSNEDV